MHCFFSPLFGGFRQYLSPSFCVISLPPRPLLFLLDGLFSPGSPPFLFPNTLRRRGEETREGGEESRGLEGKRGKEEKRVLSARKGVLPPLLSFLPHFLSSSLLTSHRLPDTPSLCRTKVLFQATRTKRKSGLFSIVLVHTQLNPEWI